MLGETVVCATISLHLYILSYTQAQCYLPLQQLHFSSGDFYCESVMSQRPLQVKAVLTWGSCLKTTNTLLYLPQHSGHRHYDASPCLVKMQIGRVALIIPSTLLPLTPCFERWWWPLPGGEVRGIKENAGRGAGGARKVSLTQNQRRHGARQDRPEGVEGSAVLCVLAPQVVCSLHLKVTVHWQEIGDKRHFLVTGAANGTRHAHQDGHNVLAQDICKQWDWWINQKNKIKKRRRRKKSGTCWLPAPWNVVKAQNRLKTSILTPPFTPVFPFIPWDFLEPDTFPRLDCI